MRRGYGRAVSVFGAVSDREGGEIEYLNDRVAVEVVGGRVPPLRGSARNPHGGESRATSGVMTSSVLLGY